ncbi:guanitoxin biosynthesis L-enduracididine beta-hydroxylase GntD [Jatrophihabitans sp.]|jgi:Fe(II)/alpha-ketoglutarate-dependent arginine beta-hydroxylase|uniref:guanitoxin biosynthesis L-enduracididine beta-hydroxylase GntD n=1 Tax=Jatrophihabitans sp. TaxID=1932789 RepID=UPI002F079887
MTGIPTEYRRVGGRSRVDLADELREPRLAGLTTVPVGRGGTVLNYQVRQEDARRVLSIASSLARRYPWVHDPEFLAEAAVAAQELPAEIRRVCNLARLQDRTHATVLSGALADQHLMAETPLHWREADLDPNAATGYVAGYVLVLYASLFGDPIGWLTQQEGRIVTDVLPIPGLETSQVSSSSEKELGWHTEDAFSTSRADYVGLMCLRSRGHTATTLSYVQLDELPPDVVDVLFQERFVIHPDTSHEPVGTAQPSQGAAAGITSLPSDPPPVALLSGHRNAPVLRIDRDFTQAADGDAEAADALRAVVSHLDRNLYDLVLDQGCVGFIDNRNVVHGRRPFRAYYDGKDRWLKRVNVVTDLRRTRPGRAVSGTRVIG